MRRCRNRCWRFLGIGLIAVGGIIVLCFMPAWLWVLIIGIVLVGAGVLLLLFG
ncbi:MAG: hypothetical protein ACRDBM_11850 [Sporomusa sp.]